MIARIDAMAAGKNREAGADGEGQGLRTRGAGGGGEVSRRAGGAGDVLGEKGEAGVKGRGARVRFPKCRVLAWTQA